MNELDLIRKRIRQYMNEIADDLASGVATDHAHYRYMVGIVTGLAYVEREIIDIAERAAQED